MRNLFSSYKLLHQSSLCRRAVVPGARARPPPPAAPRLPDAEPRWQLPVVTATGGDRHGVQGEESRLRLGRPGLPVQTDVWTWAQRSSKFTSSHNVVLSTKGDLSGSLCSTVVEKCSSFTLAGHKLVNQQCEVILKIPVVVAWSVNFVSILQVMKLIQIIAQARQTAKRISDHSNEVAANTSFLSWFGFGSPDLNNTFSGAEPEESGECLKKTHEFLDRALENLCQIFKVRLIWLLFSFYPLLCIFSQFRLDNSFNCHIYMVRVMQDCYKNSYCVFLFLQRRNGDKQE